MRQEIITVKYISLIQTTLALTLLYFFFSQKVFIFSHFKYFQHVQYTVYFLRRNSKKKLNINKSRAKFVVQNLARETSLNLHFRMRMDTTCYRWALFCKRIKGQCHENCFFVQLFVGWLRQKFFSDSFINYHVELSMQNTNQCRFVEVI